jgi:hypothetical protein
MRVKERQKLRKCIKYPPKNTKIKKKYLIYVIIIRRLVRGNLIIIRLFYLLE